MCCAGSTETNEKIDCILKELLARTDRRQTIEVAISAATDEERRLVEAATNLQFVLCEVPTSDARERQRIEQEFAAAAPWYERCAAAGGRREHHPASVSRFVWTGPEDSTEEVERMMLRIQALIGWDELPAELVQCDVHTEYLFNVRIEESTPWIRIYGMLLVLLLLLLQLQVMAKDK